MRFEGKLKSWHDNRGFGFIEPTLGGQEIFVHIKSFPPGTKRPSIGQVITFEVALNSQGKKHAINTQYPVKQRKARAPRQESSAPWTGVRLAAIPAFMMLYSFVVLSWQFKPLVALSYVAASLITFMMYAFDKSAAIKGQWRTPESTLHLLSLACGWPGALLAQQLLRHKTTKPGFIVTFWFTVVCNVTAFTLLHSPIVNFVKI